MQTIGRLAFGLLVIAVSSAAMAANPTMTGMVRENGLACTSATMDAIIRLLRKADAKGHKAISESLKKGDCIEINSGASVVILGRDLNSSYSRNNHLIWHSNGKVYSIADNRVIDVAPLTNDPSIPP